jgi:hypothetical protein
MDRRRRTQDGKGGRQKGGNKKEEAKEDTGTGTAIDQQGPRYVCTKEPKQCAPENKP